MRLRKMQWRVPIVTAVGVAGLGALGLSLYTAAKWSAPGPISRTPVPPATAARAVASLAPPNLLRPLTPEEATEENAERPFVNRPDTPAGKFILRTDATDRDRALTCLTQAVYYEAASEGIDGGRAVAQVVLNRMHHPGYPSSVCGVVYQGADRATGCQFTFTCDGSLLRTPVGALWDRSRKIAEEALKGRVFAPIGHATHYHADYVLPYWADSLDKMVQVGRHIFYRFRSSLGESRAFYQRYGGVEPRVSAPATGIMLPPSEATEQLANALISDDIEGVKDVEKAAPAPTPPLLIDSTHGTLIADAEAPPPSPKRTRPVSDCAAKSGSKQVAPLGANDLRASGASPGC